jgi:predicted dehydrogenase
MKAKTWGSRSRVKACMVGCKKIDDAHATAISSISDCEIVGVCDNEELIAKQLYKRYKVKQFASSG